MDLITDLKGLNGIEFSLGDNKKLIGIDNLKKMKQSLSEYIDYVEYWEYYINLYEDYDIEKELEDAFNGKDYSVGNVFYQYMEDGVDIEDFLKEKLEYFDELSIDNARGFTYVYIKSKDTTRKFLTWVYNNLIKPKLDTFK